MKFESHSPGEAEPTTSRKESDKARESEESEEEQHDAGHGDIRHQGNEVWK
jgi:hypothetical protein